MLSAISKHTHPTVTLAVPTYSGYSDLQSPRDYLDSLTLYQRAMGLDDEVLGHIVLAALTDTEDKWYRLSGHRAATLDEFCAAFPHEFLPDDYESRMPRELELCAQAPDESLQASCEAGKREHRLFMKARATKPLLLPSAHRAGSLAGAHAPFILVTIAGSEFSALLDMGASASLFGKQVSSPLRKHSVRLRDCQTTFTLAKGVAQSAGAARLTVRWGNRMRRTRFVHLPGLSVPAILGRDFLLKTGIVVDIANGGYRDGPFFQLKPFISPLAYTVACAVEASEPCHVQSSGAVLFARRLKIPIGIERHDTKRLRIL